MDYNRSSSPHLFAFQLNYEMIGIVLNDGPSWKEHRHFVTHEFRKFGFGNQSIEQRIQLVVDEYLHEISVSRSSALFLFGF
jgi:cytochrome P450